MTLVVLGSGWLVWEWCGCVMLGGAGVAGDQPAKSGQQLWAPAATGGNGLGRVTAGILREGS